MLNHIELAKKCGGFSVHEKNIHTSLAGHVIFTTDQLTAFANAIIEECAMCADNMEIYTALDVADAIRALKVEG